jgi:polyisoprenoid-binding protein YceI
MTATATLVTPATAGTYTIDPAHSEVQFRVRHLLTRAGGRFGSFAGTIKFDPSRPEASSVTFSIDAASLDTNVPDRDAHLKSPDFFDIEKYPAITFTSDRVTSTGEGVLVVAGTLALHGVSKRIEVPVTYLGTLRDPWGNDKASFEATATLNRKDFGMAWNKMLDNGGIFLGDEVTITISVEAGLAG